MESKIFELVEKGDPKVLRDFLQDNHSVINSQDKHGATPLHIAVWNRDSEIIKVLLINGASMISQTVINSKNKLV